MLDQGIGVVPMLGIDTHADAAGGGKRFAAQHDWFGQGVLDFGQHVADVGMVAAFGCRAKRDLAVGETLDAIGEYSYRGFSLSVRDAREWNALPIGLAQGARIIRQVAKGALITRADAEPDASLNIVAVRQRQDAMVAQMT